MDSAIKPETPLYPNDDGILNISIPEEHAIIKVFNAEGKLRYTFRATRFHCQIDVRRYASGLYKIKLFCPSGLIVNHYTIIP